MSLILRRRVSAVSKDEASHGLPLGVALPRKAVYLWNPYISRPIPISLSNALLAILAKPAD